MLKRKSLGAVSHLATISALSVFILCSLLSGVATAASNRLTLNVVQVFGTIDPAKVTDYTEYMAAVNFYDGLVTVGPDASIQPLLARDWETSDDGKVFTFHLHEGVKFHDGSEVTAEDVVYSMRRTLTLNQGPAYLWNDVLAPEDVVAVDRYTVRFTLNKTYSPFLATLAVLFVVNEDQVKANEVDGDWGQKWLTDHEAGSGSYTLAGWQRGSEIRFAKFDDYFRGWRDGSYDEIRIVVTNNESTVLSMARTGQLQMTSQYQAQETYNALDRFPNFEVREYATATMYNLKLNTQKAPTDDVHVRRAIAYAIDYETIRDVIYPGDAPQGLLSPLFAVHNDDVPVLEQDFEKARQELQKSAYAGEPITVSLSYVAGNAFEEQASLLMQANLQQIGIKAELQPEPWNRITELAASTETTPHITHVFIGPTYSSPDSVFYTQYHSEAHGTWNAMSWLDDEQVDQLIKSARGTIDPDEQENTYKELQVRLFDLMPDIPLVVQMRKYAFQTDVQGYTYIPSQSFDFNFHRFYREQ